jgi:hypothetical protein
MASLHTGRERRALQSTVTLLALIPILAGLTGVVCGLSLFDAHADLSRTGDSHVRYLSGVMLAIGLGFWSTVPRIEVQGARFRLLTALVLTGGLARLYALALFGLPAVGMLAGLVMELLVTPGLACWREDLERRTRAAAAPSGLPEASCN